MRRGRNLSGVIAVLAILAATAVVPSALADGGTPNHHHQNWGSPGASSSGGTDWCSQADTSNPLWQGYCQPITPPPPPPTTTPTPPPTTPPTPPTTPPTTCSGTAGSTTGGSGSGGSNCTTPPPPAPTPTPTPVGIAPVIVVGVQGAQHTATPAPKPVAAVKGAQHTVTTPPKTAVAPLTATKRSGTLPFTGAQLTLFVLVGLGLVATGLVLRSTARRSHDR